MSIFSTIKVIAMQKNISIYRIEHDLELPNGIIRRWNVSDPSATNLQKVADYLGVTSTYILNKSKEGE
ncbi:XRE family transcriptional regulator [Companilactobacillus hulinensis]|uniref:XRE family transcriptional regulator n=1 Tax=Companilactobacillus hulinensis TaxID=2486007 RepID=UPI000F79DBAA|nr:XRE family transcriptional regulator [Companilactobacillus hulinensis]